MMLLVAHNNAAQHVAVAGQIFCRAMHHHVRAQFQRAKNHRCGESAVHYQRRARLARERGNPVDCADSQQRVRNAFHEDTAGLLAGDGPLHRVEIACVDEVTSTPKGAST